MTPEYHTHMSHVLRNHVFAVIPLREKKLFAFLYLSSYCHVTGCVVCRNHGAMGWSAMLDWRHLSTMRHRTYNLKTEF